MTQRNARLEPIASLPIPPGNITLAADGRLFMSIHQFSAPEHCVCELVDGAAVPYPQGPEADSLDLRGVLGIQVDRDGHLWMLDNGLQNQMLPKLVAWDIHRDRLARVIYLPEPISTRDSFINDLAIDLDRGMIYISDPIQETSAVIRVDLATGQATRVLEGHESVVPEQLDLIIDGVPVEIARDDGPPIRPHLGVNGIVLDAENEWVYLSPMHNTGMYRVRSADLADPALGAEALAERVERYSDKPICDGITIDRDENLYVGDLAANAIGVITADRSYEAWADPRLIWVDSLGFGPDGALYCNSNQLHRTATLNAGVDATEPPFTIFRVEPLAPGVVGR